MRQVGALFRAVGMCCASGLAAVPVAAQSAEEEARNTRGRVVYETYCAGCHGVSGDGKGPAAEMLIVKPRDFTSGVYKFRSTPTGELPTTADLYRTITHGAYGTSMPSWRLLSEQQRYEVIDYIKAFYPSWEEEDSGEAIHVSAAPAWIGSQKSIARGQQIYELLDCAQCHGERGRGDGPSAADLDPDLWGNPQKPFDFTKGSLRGGPRVEDIYRTFMTGVGGTAMPSYADIFEEPDGEYIFSGDAWHLVSYVLSLRPSASAKGEPRP